MPLTLPHPRLVFFLLALVVLGGGTYFILRQQPMLACQSRREQLKEMIAAKRSCDVDADCTMLVRGCGAFATCGEPVRADALKDLEVAVNAFEEQCSGLGGLVCVSCIQQHVRCIQDQCTAQIGAAP